MTIAHHLVFSGYGTWLSNDLRGSGSTEIRKNELSDLGPIHVGRKRVQPARSELREFYRRAEPLLDFKVLWFDDPVRRAIGEAFGRVIAERGYTAWACAVCSNHAHLLPRIHRDDALTMWHAFADASREAVRALPGIPPDHPVWSDRPYKVFLETPPEVEGRVGYIWGNPLKEGLEEQRWPFVVLYDGWPLRHRRKTRGGR